MTENHGMNKRKLILSLMGLGLLVMTQGVAGCADSDTKGSQEIANLRDNQNKAMGGHNSGVKSSVPEGTATPGK